MRVIYIDISVTETKRSYKLVAFSKGLTKTINRPKKDETIVFNKVILNAGANMYSNAKFICVSPGLYIFHVNILANKGKVSWLDIYKNNESVGTAYGYTSGYWGSAGTTVILLLVAGDAVYVRPNQDSTNANSLYGKPHLLYSTFTGELLDSEIWGKFYKTFGSRLAIKLFNLRNLQYFIGVKYGIKICCCVNIHSRLNNTPSVNNRD